MRTGSLLYSSNKLSIEDKLSDFKNDPPPRKKKKKKAKQFLMIVLAAGSAM